MVIREVKAKIEGLCIILERAIFLATIGKKISLAVWVIEVWISIMVKVCDKEFVRTTS